MANKRFEVFVDRPQQEFVGKSVYELFPHDVADALWENDLAALKAEGPIEVEETVSHKDGSLHTYLTSKFPLYREEHEPFGICAISTDITERKETEKEREKLIHDLEKAFADVEVLSGLLPICSLCKKIHDDKGYWNQIEKYIGDRSKVDFSHGVCPECVEKLYPGLGFSDEETSK